MIVNFYELLDLECGGERVFNERSKFQVVEPVKKQTDADIFKSKFAKLGPQKSQSKTTPLEHRVKQEVNRYLKIKPANLDTLQFWSDLRNDLPTLHDLAIHVLLAPATCLNSDRTYSVATRIVSKFRRNANVEWCSACYMFLIK